MTCNRDREKIKAYKRAEYKSEAPFIHNGDFVRRDAALYDPRRDDPLHHADLTALLMGDPLIGRRAIDHSQAPLAHHSSGAKLACSDNPAGGSPVNMET